MLIKEIGLDQQQVAAQLLLTSKLIHPSSELETERWLNENSGALELYNNVENTSRYKLYQAATKTYQQKEKVDRLLYDNIKNQLAEDI